MKKIAITQRIILNKDYPEIREALDIRWGLLFKELNFLPVILPYNYNFTDFEFDGVILSGGNDINEVNFRDDFESKLIKYCISNNIPIFGVCRGMQIIAQYFGSTFKIVDKQVNIQHKLVVNKNSRYFKYLNNIKEVNSFHNYGIDKLSDELIVSAYCDTGLIKAVEHKKYNIFGQMWHSERTKPFNMDELNLIKEFFI